MSRLLMACVLLCGLSCLALAEPAAVPAAPAQPAAAPVAPVTEPAPFTTQDARASVQEAVDLLVRVNQQIADDYFHTGDFDKSVTVLDRLIMLAPDNVNNYANAAWLLWSSNKTDEALRYYQLAIANNPTNPDAYFIVGQYYFLNRRQFSEALPYLQKAVDLGGPSMQRHLYAHCLEKVGRTDDALAAWRKILADDPTDDVAQKEIDRLVKGLPDAPAVGDQPAK